jgi:hypothetical protein
MVIVNGEPVVIITLITDETHETNTNVEELQRYIKHLNLNIATQNENQRLLWIFGEKMIERVKEEKKKNKQLQETHTGTLDALMEAEGEIMEQKELIKSLTLKCRKLKKKKIELKEANGDLITENHIYRNIAEKLKAKNAVLETGIEELRSRVCDYEWVLKCEEKLKAENEELKEENEDLVMANYTLDKRFDELEEKLKAENAELKEKLKHYLPWYERAKMEEQEETEEN